MEFYAGTQIQKNLGNLNRSQWWKPEEIKEFQNKKVKHLIEHAYTNVPYYRHIFKQKNLLPHDITSVDDLQQLPFLTKDIIKKNFQDLIAKNFIKNSILDNTSGSTGEPLKYYNTNEAISIGWASTYRGWGWAGYELGDKRITFGFWRDYKTSDTSTMKNIKMMKRLRYSFERNLPFSTFNLNEGILKSYISNIIEYKPKFIRGYPSALTIFAKYIDINHIENIKPHAIITTAETLLPLQRRKIEEVFGCPVFDGYGCRDGGANAMECSEHFGYHICAEQCYLETIKTDENVCEGEQGEIVTTDFYNYAMPFIRYRTGDLGTLSDEKCSCGRGLPILKSIKGRLINLFVHSDGSYLSGLPLTDVFEHLEQIKNDTIRQYQVIQETRDRLLIKIIKGKNFSENNEKKIISEMKKHLGDRIIVIIEYVDNIPTTPGGKRHYVISYESKG